MVVGPEEGVYRYVSSPVVVCPEEGGRYVFSPVVVGPEEGVDILVLLWW